AQKSEEPAANQAETPERDSPVLDLSDQAVKRLIKTAKSLGYVTYDELKADLPSEEASSQQIEDVMAMFSEMGINVVETEEGEEPQAGDDGADEEEGRSLTAQTMPATTQTRAEPVERTDDPVRMY